MLQLAAGFLVIALIAGLFGFGFMANSFMAVAQGLFFGFIAVAVFLFIFGSRALKRWQA